MPYDPTIYRGAAEHYWLGRPPYSPQLQTVLADELKLDGSGRMLDVGCGPGTLAVRFAPLFEQVVALDPDSEMLAEGQRVAAARGINNIHWVHARAEELPAAAPGRYGLATFGQSFWWTDQENVTTAIYDMLEAGGAMAVISHTVEGRPVPQSPGNPPIPHAEIEALVASYLGPTRRASTTTRAAPASRSQDVLARSAFGAPMQLFLPGIPDLLRTSESVLSGYFSFSTAAPHLFGDRVNEFAAEVRALLAQRSPEGTFWDWPGDTEVLLAHKPPAID